MRYVRSSLAVASIGSLLLGAQLIACGGDDDNDNAAPASIDAGTTTDSGTTGPVLTISDSRGKVYLGQTAKIDGASVAPNLTTNVKWVVLAAPSESAIKTESLQGADSTTPSFKPDVLGQYTLQASGDSSSVVVLIEAIDAPVFYREATVTGTTTGQLSLNVHASTHVGGAYGSFNRAVDCPATLVEDGGDESSLYLAIIGARTASWGDTWEGAPGTPSRVAVPMVQPNFPTSSAKFALLVATSQSACNSPDAKTLFTVESDGGTPSPSDAVWGVRFSPDGNRLAYMGETQGKGHLVTIGFDGSAKRDLGATQALPDGGALDPDASTDVRPMSPLALGPVQPRWKDSTHVSWASFFSTDDESQGDHTAWNLYVAEDKDGAQPELVMTCTKVGLQSFDFLPDGSIIAAAAHEISVGEGDEQSTEYPMDLLVYRANANKECELVRNLTNNKQSNDLVRDLALSPDKTQVAFFSGTGSSQGLDSNSALWLSIAQVDGSTAPSQVPGAGMGAVAGIGPRWIAGGTALTWGHQDINITGGNNGSIPGGMGKQVAIPVAGGVRKVVAEGSQAVSADGGIEFHVVSGVGQGCSVNRGALSSGVMAGGVALGLASLIARRRRRSN